MSTTNGYAHPHKSAEKEQLTPEEMKVKWQRVRIANKLRREEMESELLESYNYDYGPYWGGSDNNEQLFRLRDQTTGLFAPIALGSDRKGGAKWPMWRVDQDRHRLMQASRICCAQNTYAQGLLRNLTNYIIGTGFKYKAAPKKMAPFQADPDQDDLTNQALKKQYDLRQKFGARIAAQVQQWIDAFCAANNINGEAPPIDEDDDSDGAAVNSASSTVEREAFWRVPRDGEAFLRLFLNDDGTVTVRFVGPEMIWGTPPNESQTHGWYFGVKHLVTEDGYLDLGKVVGYFVRPRDVGTVSQYDIDNGWDHPDDQFVKATEMIHIKDAWEDAEVSRGTPMFSYDMLEALNRAAKLQRNMSISSAVRAARAEVWKQATGTQAQITALQQGPGVRTVTDPYGGTRTEQILPPGRVSHVSNGWEPVPYSTTTNIPDHQMAAQGDLRQACAGISAPEYMTGTTNEANYATASEAGTPFVLAAESEQAHYRAAFLRLMWRVVRWAVKCGKLPREALSMIDIEVGGREVKKNNEAELAQARQVNMNLKLVSPQSEIMKLGGDPHQVISDWEAWTKQMGQIQPPQAPGGAPGAPGASIPDAGRSAAAKQAWTKRIHGATGGEGESATESRESQELIPGGLGDHRPDSDFDAEQLAAGIKVEMEHTNDPNIAKEIAKDHLTEDKDYYRKLKKIEVKESWLELPDDFFKVS